MIIFVENHPSSHKLSAAGVHNCYSDRHYKDMDQNQPHSADIEKWLRLIRSNGLGPVGFAKLIRHFGSVDHVLGASVSQLCQVSGIGHKTAEQIVKTRRKFDVNRELELADKLGVWIINIQDERYPVVLKKIYAPPAVLYIKGTLSRMDNLSVAMVGCRRCSTYGREQSSRLAHFLSSAGITICSGMARGIDTAAHQGALSAGGRTIAVQGCGLAANVFPPENKRLFELISQSGACISELPMEYEPLAENFPPRNRIIAGLSLGTIVIEAPIRSGAMITARAALENNREVMAVPGKIDSPLSKGTHLLLKQGATLVESVEDVMQALGCLGSQLQSHASEAAKKASEKIDAPLFNAANLNLSGDEGAIYKSLGKETLHIDQLISLTGLAAGIINASLVSLRLKGLVRQLPGSLFLKR